MAVNDLIASYPKKPQTFGASKGDGPPYFNQYNIYMKGIFN